MRRWQPYPAYKAPNLEWLGEIPVHWRIKRLKFTAAESLQYGANEAAELQDPGFPRFIRITDINTDGTLRDDTFRSLPPDIAAPYLLKSEDILLARSGATVGKSFMYQKSWGEACYAGYLIRYRPNRKIVIPAFVFAFLNSSIYWNWISSTLIQATIQNVSGEKYANLAIPIPPITEQQVIAAFLDRETAQIDALIAEQRRLIELLQERRAALISHAVTKGLDPDVEMVDSGVEWLGKIPAHWTTTQIRYISESLQTGPFGSQLHSSDYVPGGTPVINPSHMKDGHLEADPEIAIDEETRKRLGHHELSIGDIVFARRGDLGRCALVTENEEGWLCGTGSLRMRPKQRLAFPPFLNQVFSAKGISEWLILQSVGSTMDNLNTSILSKLPLPLPPLSEQQAITKHLDSEMTKIDDIVEEAKHTIAQLEEYRTALIAAAVTGKIDVRPQALAADTP